MYTLTADNISKRFGERKVLSKISFEITQGESLAVVGDNGSGKSTLLKILLSLLLPTKGTVTYAENGKIMTPDEIRPAVSFVSPYLNLYDQLTGEENLQFFATMGGRQITGKEINDYLDKVGLSNRGMDFVGGYSSGMKQRLKYAVALLNEPRFLFLDEPTSNLDDAGKQIVTDIIEMYRPNAAIIIATNEQEEYQLAQKLCRING